MPTSATRSTFCAGSMARPPRINKSDSAAASCDAASEPASASMAVRRVIGILRGYQFGSFRLASHVCTSNRLQLVRKESMLRKNGKDKLALPFHVASHVFRKTIGESLFQSGVRIHVG